MHQKSIFTGSGVLTIFSTYGLLLDAVKKDKRQCCYSGEVKLAFREVEEGRERAGKKVKQIDSLEALHTLCKSFFMY